MECGTRMEFLSHKGTITSGNVAKWAGGKEERMEATPNVIRDNTKKTEAREASRREMFGEKAPKSRQIRAGNLES